MRDWVRRTRVLPLVSVAALVATGFLARPAAASATSINCFLHDASRGLNGQTIHGFCALADDSGLSRNDGPPPAADTHVRGGSSSIGAAAAHAFFGDAGAGSGGSANPGGFFPRSSGASGAAGTSTGHGGQSAPEGFLGDGSLQDGSSDGHYDDDDLG